MSRYQARLPLLFTTLVFITTVMRPPVASVGPLLSEIQTSLSLEPFQTALLAAVPVVCFGFGAFLTPWLVAKLGVIDTFTVILGSLTVALLLRPWFGYGILLALTVVAGLGIALVNVAITTLVRDEFPTQVSKITAYYTALLGVFASLGALLAVPLQEATGSWNASLFFWGVISALAFILWLLTNRGLGHDESRGSKNQILNPRVWRSGATWGIVGYFGFQSLVFYAILNWLPSLLEAKGFSALEAGTMLSFAAVVGVPVGLVVTANLRRIPSIWGLMLVIGGITATGILLLLAPAQFSWLASGVTGVGLAMSFPLSIALIGLKGSSSTTTTALSALAQGFGYLLAAVGTYVVGVLGVGPAGWSSAVWTLFAIVIAGVASGLLVTRSSSV